MRLHEYYDSLTEKDIWLPPNARFTQFKILNWYDRAKRIPNYLATKYTILRMLKERCPLMVWHSTSRFLNPGEVGPKGLESRTNHFLKAQLYAIDIDRDNLEDAKKATNEIMCNLAGLLDVWLGRITSCGKILYTGKKGFQIWIPWKEIGDTPEFDYSSVRDEEIALAVKSTRNKALRKYVNEHIGEREKNPIVAETMTKAINYRFTMMLLDGRTYQNDKGEKRPYFDYTVSYNTRQVVKYPHTIHRDTGNVTEFVDYYKQLLDYTPRKLVDKMPPKHMSVHAIHRGYEG